MGTSSEGLSVCIITRDQEAKLKKCLEALKKGLPEAEIVVLDTGSSDDTLETARSYTENVREFSWCGDFSAAKNEAVRNASFDTVLILDTDEYIEGGSDGLKETLKLFRKYPEAVGRILRRNSYVNDLGQETEYSEWINRLFDRRLFYYEGRIHEQVVRISGEDKEDYKTYRTGIRIFHDGYDLTPEELKEKAERNASLLQEELKEKPDDPYLFYQLGKTFFVSGDRQRAAEELLRALELKPHPDQEYLTDLIILAGYALLETGEPGEALKLLEGYAGDKRYGEDSDFMFLYATLLMNNTRFKEAMDTFIFCTELPPSRTKGTNSYLSWYNAGVIAEVSGDKESAARFYGRAGSYEKAAEGLKRCRS